jgi:hypothetical protein
MGLAATLAAAVIVACPMTAGGDIVVMRDGTVRVGLVEGQDAEHVRLAERTADGHRDVRQIPVGDTVEVIRTIDHERLARLDPSAPREYALYAEELARFKGDPEAVELAIRLLVIAAYWGDEAAQRASLLTLVVLARSPDERARLEALADLPNREATLRTDGSTGSAQGEPIALSPDVAERARAAVRAVRQGDPPTAERLLAEEDVCRALASLDDCPDVADLIAWSAADNIGAAELVRLLRAELSLAGRPTQVAQRDAEAWEAAEAQHSVSAPWVAIDTVTEFDPRQAWYRDGQWIAQEGTSPRADRSP